jgi:hypothetical protein
MIFIALVISQFKTLHYILFFDNELLRFEKLDSYTIIAVRIMTTPKHLTISEKKHVLVFERRSNLKRL